MDGIWGVHEDRDPVGIWHRFMKHLQYFWHQFEVLTRSAGYVRPRVREYPAVLLPNRLQSFPARQVPVRTERSFRTILLPYRQQFLRSWTPFLIRSASHAINSASHRPVTSSVPRRALQIRRLARFAQSLSR